MNTKKTSFDSVLDALLDTRKEFPHRYLTLFSDIGTLELKTLLDVWSRVDLKRKLSLLEGLGSLADGDTLVNFNDFAHPLLDDPDAQVRVRALRLLSESEDATLLPQLLTMLNTDADVHVRVEVAHTLGYFIALGELEVISQKAYGEIKAGLLESARGSGEMRVRRQALESLGFSSDEEVVKLIESVLNKMDSDWQASVLVAMGRSADERWEEDVLRGLTDEDNRVRHAAVQAAGNLALRSASPILLRLLEEDDDDDVTSATIWSLSQIGGEDARTYLENLLDQTEDEEQTEYLEEALENLAFTEDLERFELMSFNPDALDDFEVDDDEVEEEDK